MRPRPTTRRIELDGGLSTALEELGADLDDPLWTARVLRDQPDLVLAASHARTSRAGAEIVISASYQAPDECWRRACGSRAGRVCWSRPPSRRTARRWRAGRVHRRLRHARRAGTSGACGCCSTPTRFLAIETQPRADEAAAIAALVEGTDCWVTFTCADGERTGHGERIEDAVEAVAGFDAVGRSA